jgi:hypothetical protein
MAQATYNVTTSAGGVNKLWRKVQGELAVGFDFESDEWAMMPSIKKYKIDVSAREVTVPLDINEDAGVASIDEGGLEARPSSPNIEELTLNYILLNARFTASVTAQLLDQYQRAAELKRQIVYQGMKKVQALARAWSDYFYGFSTGVLATTTTAATQSSGSYTLATGYGQATITNAALLADKFKVNDAVALIRAGVLVANAIGIVTGVAAGTPSIAVTWNGSVVSMVGDQIVRANSMENTTLVGTDFNRGMTGILDCVLSTSVHGLSSASVPNWQVAYSDTSVTRWSGVMLHRANDEIRFNGGGKVDLVIIAPGVYRDVLSLQQAALRFQDPFALELDGQIKSQGVKFFSSKRTPNSWVFCLDSRSFRKLDVMPSPTNQMSWGDMIRMENSSGYIAPISMLTQMVCLNRKNLSYFSGKLEQ